jgi:nucleoredoxin
MSSLVSLFPEKIQGKDGLVDSTEALSGKFTMIYFSAHWCPPCRGFTPKLAKFYNDLKATRSDFELVFVSSDKDQSAFDEYYAEMPWLALPFEDRARKAALSKKYKVNGIPSLVVLDKDGELITDDGRSGVMEDPQGESFPWIPKTFEEVFPSTLQGKDGEVDASSLDDKYLMIYFSAHWCPPCRGFTPELVKVYEKLKAGRSDLELVFASSDRDEKSFDEYYAEMPWLALRYSDRDAKNALSKVFNVEGIPTLVVLDKKIDGKRKVINGGARSDATLDNVGEFPWPLKPYADLSKGVDCNGSDINDSPAILVLCEGADDDEQAEIVAAVKEVASKQKGGDLLFFYGCTLEGPVPRVRELCKLKDPEKVILMKLDIPDNGGYYVSDENDITVENIEKFIASPGNRQQLG